MIYKLRKSGVIFSPLLLLLIIMPVIIFTTRHFSFEIITNFYSQKTFNVLLNTLTQSTISVAISLLISIIPAIYIATHKTILANLTSHTIFIPFFFPSVSAGIAFSLLLKNTDLNYSLFAITLAHIFYNSPILVKYISDSLRNIDIKQIESAKIDGANNFKIAWYIIIPQITDGLSRGIFLAFTYCFTSFAVILSVGNIKYSTFETAIASSLTGNINFSKAISYFFIQLVILSLINLFLHKKNENIKEYTPIMIKKKNILHLFTFLYLLFEAFIVLHTVIYSFYNNISNSFEISAFLKLFSKEFNENFPVILSILNSLLISIIVAFIATTIAYILLSFRDKFLSYFITGGIAISSAFYAVTLYFLNIIFDIPMSLLLIFGLFVITLPIAYSFMYDNFKNFDYTLIEAALTDGADRFTIFRFIKFPLLKFTIIGTILQVFTIAYGEFTLSFSMKIHNSIPLASITNYNIASKRLLQESAAMSCVNIIIILIVFNTSSWIESKMEN